MMIGIGTPRSQSRIPRPMGLSFQPTFLGCTIADARVLFPSRGSGQTLRIESSTEPTQNRSLGPPPLPRSPKHARMSGLSRILVGLRPDSEGQNLAKFGLPRVPQALVRSSFG
jgi:hypothetical protein